jgi:hypothetical protein
MRNSAMAGAAILTLMGAAGAYADSQIWRPAIDAIGNAASPASEGAAGLPDGVEFGPQTPAPRGRVTIDDSATPLAPTPHARRRKILAIGR